MVKKNPGAIASAQDQPEQTGALALYLASSRADYLKGSLTSVNWDLEEMEERKSVEARGSDVSRF